MDDRESLTARERITDAVQLLLANWERALDHSTPPEDERRAALERTIGFFGYITLLEALRKLDEPLADELARWIDAAQTDGGSNEWAGPWQRELTEGRELTLPTLTASDGSAAWYRERITLLRKASEGRREYAEDERGDARVALEVEAATYATAVRILEGDDSPLYSLLPSWRWSPAMQVSHGAGDTAAAHPTADANVEDDLECCFLAPPCGQKAEWVIVHGRAPDALTEACSAHVGMLLTGAPEQHIYPITPDRPLSSPAPQRVNQAIVGGEVAARAHDGVSITIPRPHIPYGPDHLTAEQSDIQYLRKAADELQDFYRPFGSNLRATIVKMMRDAANAIAGATARQDDRKVVTAELSQPGQDLL